MVLAPCPAQASITCIIIIIIVISVYYGYISHKFSTAFYPVANTFLLVKLSSLGLQVLYQPTDPSFLALFANSSLSTQILNI